jgi:sugar lactone lactonase YvrE
VVCVAPDGKIEHVVDMPVRDITTCAFGGDDLKTLYITTAGMMTQEGGRLAGSLYALETDAPGLDGYRARIELMEAVR